MKTVLVLLFATALHAQQAPSAFPCKNAPEFRQFDFWIGEWTVQNPKGETIASSSIQLILGDCVIFENYVTVKPPYSGKSFSLFNSAAKRWEQKWVDNQGGLHDYIGELKEGEMRFRRETTTAQGQKIHHRMTFYPLGPDRVRQKLERSTDGGATWTTGWEGLYLRKK